MGESVTSMGALSRQKYTKGIPHRRGEQILRVCLGKSGPVDFA